MDVLQAIRNTLIPKLKGKGTAYLYGSRAKGTARDDSDWDVLVVVDKPTLTQEDYNEFTYPLSALGWDLEQVISPIMYTKSDWQRQNFTPFYKNVEQDKIILV